MTNTKEMTIKEIIEEANFTVKRFTDGERNVYMTYIPADAMDIVEKYNDTKWNVETRSDGNYSEWDKEYQKESADLMIKSIKTQLDSVSFTIGSRKPIPKVRFKKDVIKSMGIFGEVTTNVYYFQLYFDWEYVTGTLCETSYKSLKEKFETRTGTFRIEGVKFNLKELNELLYAINVNGKFETRLQKKALERVLTRIAMRRAGIQIPDELK